MGTITKYASTLEQVQDDRFQTNQWSDLNNAVGNTNLFASSYYRGKTIPSQLYAHNFGLSLPTQFKIKNINVEVKIRGSVNALVPRCWFVYRGYGHTNIGYSDDVFSDQPNQRLSDAFSTITYNMDWSEVVQYKLSKSYLESDVFGVILQFNDATQINNGGVSVEWVRVTVEYDEPEYVIEIKGNVANEEYLARYYNKYSAFTYADVQIKIHNTGSMASQSKSVKINIPLGLKLIEYSTSTYSDFDPDSRYYTCDWEKEKSPYLNLKLQCRTTGVKEINVTGDSSIGSLSKWLFVEKGYALHSDEDISVTSSDVRRWAESCFHFVVKTINDDGTAGFDIFVDGNGTNHNELVRWTLDEELSSDGVSINTYTNSYINFNVPANKEVEIHFTGCFLPKTTGDNFLQIEAEDSGQIFTYDYTSLEPYTYVIEPSRSSHDMVWSLARVTTQIETGAWVYPMGVSEYDSSLVIDRSTLRLSLFDDIDYIGCVPLKQTHFDPKSTYKDTLLNTTYKNKTYMGKKGAIDETITLNVRLPPHDVTTIQGLVQMDKPVPINANHLSFEGDSLNHRGWAELYGITSEKTNPHWYKCVLSVKYITHNLNTRFSINKGSRVSDYFLPELMSSVCEYGDDISNNFYIQTNGGFMYNDDNDDYHMRNIFQLPYGKSFELKQINRLSLKSEINFNWYSSRNVENNENNIRRIIKLVDAETENAVLEYEYYDVDFSRSNAYNCRVICRVLHKGAYKTVLNRNLVLNNDVEYSGQDVYDVDIYGSEVIFKIVADKLSIQDCGFSGKELLIEDIDLQNGQYYFDVEFVNQNTTIDSVDVLNWIDIGVKELKYSSQYSNYYKNLLVSPFSVPNKKIVFTRDSEEGTIFYLEDDGTECSYMVNPYYQYHCGVDLQSKDGISIFNLDNNYKVVYIVNGLIKLGINRYNGRLTLFKYDKYSKQYIHTNTFQLTKYEDININSFTDDKLEMQVSDTIITMWRGHPYIRIAHETEDILFDDNFTKVYCDGMGDKESTIPVMYNLVDTTNLLSECLGSDRLINDECWSMSVDDVTAPSSDVTVSTRVNGGLANPSKFITNYSGDYTYMKFIIDGEALDGIQSNIAGATHEIDYQFLDVGMHTVQAVYYGSEYTTSNILEVSIVDNAYKITPTFPSSMYYLQTDYTCVLTYAGEPVQGKTVTFYVNGLSYNKLTDENGVATLNNRLSPKDEKDGKSQSDDYTTKNEPYTVYMSYSDGGEILAHAEKDATILKGYVNIGVESGSHGSTTVRKGSYIIAKFTNNLDPNDDDIDPDEVYVKNKTVVLKINGVDYVRTTDSLGECRLNINLNKGHYDLTVQFSGDNQYMGTIRNFELNVVE